MDICGGGVLWHSRIPFRKHVHEFFHALAHCRFEITLFAILVSGYLISFWNLKWAFNEYLVCLVNICLQDIESEYLFHLWHLCKCLLTTPLLLVKILGAGNLIMLDLFDHVRFICFNSNSSVCWVKILGAGNLNMLRFICFNSTLSVLWVLPAEMLSQCNAGSAKWQNGKVMIKWRW